MVGFGHIRRNTSQTLRWSVLQPVGVMIAEARQARDVIALRARSASVVEPAITLRALTG